MERIFQLSLGPTLLEAYFLCTCKKVKIFQFILNLYQNLSVAAHQNRPQTGHVQLGVLLFLQNSDTACKGSPDLVYLKPKAMA